MVYMRERSRFEIPTKVHMHPADLQDITDHLISISTQLAGDGEGNGVGHPSTLMGLEIVQDSEVTRGELKFS